MLPGMRGMMSLDGRRGRGRPPAPTSVDGWPAVHCLAKLIREMPPVKKDEIRRLWSHTNKRRVRLERLGGAARRSGRGFVIDGRTVVDGLTRRMDDVLKDYNPAELRGGNMAFLQKPVEELRSDASIREAAVQAGKKDKSRAGCRALRGDPMKHGSKVHVEVYNAVRHAIRIARLYHDKRPLPAEFRIDVCTRACLLSMVSVGLVPFSAEWPAFYDRGAGCATAADVLALDARSEYRMTVVELKTGSVTRALAPARPGEAQWTGMLAAVIQCVATAAMCRACYGQDFFPWRRTGSCVLYARSWGAVRIDVPSAFWSPSVAAALCKVLVERRRGSLRAGLDARHNQQAHRTAAGRPRKREPKTYAVGFEAAEGGNMRGKEDEEDEEEEEDEEWEAAETGEEDADS